MDVRFDSRVCLVVNQVGRDRRNALDGAHDGAVVNAVNVLVVVFVLPGNVVDHVLVVLPMQITSEQESARSIIHSVG